MTLQEEISKRRTFAIISHPDAGKTTLTEKFLLFGGAIQTAGAVKSNKIKKGATSDFMDIERQRGISVSTSVMSFEYNNTIINSPKFGEKTLVHINSMNTTEKNPSVGNYQITALSDLDSSENNPYKESLSSFRENIKISSDSYPKDETVRIIIINSYKKFFV